MNRRLTLKAEHLTELSSAELSGVAGAALPTDRCFTGMYPSINMPCPTIDEPCVNVAIRYTVLCTV